MYCSRTRFLLLTLLTDQSAHPDVMLMPEYANRNVTPVLVRYFYTQEKGDVVWKPD